MAVTAKVRVEDRRRNGDEVALRFAPDYQDDRNKEWAAATPALSLSMTVKGAVADQFPMGATGTLTFEMDEQADQEQGEDGGQGSASQQ
jgi:hypothetical protein